MRSVDLHPTRRVAIRNRAATVVLMIGFAVVGTGCGSSTGTGNPSTTIGITGNGPSSSSGATGGAGGAISDPSFGLVRRREFEQQLNDSHVGGGPGWLRGRVDRCPLGYR